MKTKPVLISRRSGWPDGKPVCPHCGVIGQATLVHGKSHRSGMYQCNACREPFTAMIGTIMESSHLPMTKWALAFHLMASSKKGYSAHQLMRTLGLGSYRTAWFMAHRIREAMRIGEHDHVARIARQIESAKARGRKRGPKAKNSRWYLCARRHGHRMSLGFGCAFDQRSWKS
jgi:transposase-like protein